MRASKGGISLVATTVLHLLHLPSFSPFSVHVGSFTVVNEPLNWCAPPRAGIGAVVTTSPHFVHFPTFNPSSVHVGSFTVVNEPLNWCPVGDILPFYAQNILNMFLL